MKLYLLLTDDYEWRTFCTVAWCNYDEDNQYEAMYGRL
jgi:hypothetical protein